RLILTCPPLISTLFPYTTLFRSCCGCRFAWARDHLSLSLHGAACALQRHREVYQRAGAARKHDRERRSGIEGRANDIKYRTPDEDRKSTRLNSSHLGISYAVFCL